MQRTIRKSVSVTGIGLHSGKRVRCVFHPAKSNTGITFIRSDLEGKPSIGAHVGNVCSTTLATTVGNDEFQISTVEHFMAAAFGLGIDNIVCEVDAEELPVLDGSSKDFVHLLQMAGIRNQRALRKYVMVDRAVSIRDGDKVAEARPSKSFTVEYEIDFSHPVIGKQKFEYNSKVDFVREIAPCRTFGFLQDVERMQAMGLALGGSLDNAVVLDNVNVLNPDGLRFSNEFVRHKILDAIGDLALIGYPILGLVKLEKAGHELQTKLVRELLSDTNNYTIVTIEKASEVEEFDQMLVNTALSVS